MLDLEDLDAGGSSARGSSARTVAPSVPRQQGLLSRALADRRRVPAGDPLERVACPYCLTAFRAGDEVLLCPECRLTHHADCWQENGGCGVYGCPAAPLRAGLPNLQTPAGPNPPAPRPRYSASAYLPWICVCGTDVRAPICPTCGRTRGRAVAERVAAVDGPGRRTFRRARPAGEYRPPPVRRGVVGGQNRKVRGALGSIGRAFVVAFLTAVIVAWLISAGFVAPWIIALIGFGVFLMLWLRGVSGAVTGLRELRERPWETGRGVAGMTLVFSAVALLIILGVLWHVFT